MAPFGDGTGPRGQGPRTGRGMGGRGMGQGAGRGQGRGMGQDLRQNQSLGRRLMNFLGGKKSGTTGLSGSPGPVERLRVAIIDASRCTMCGVCVDNCPVSAISMGGNSAVIDSAVCIGCGACEQTCPKDAITMMER